MGGRTAGVMHMGGRVYADFATVDSQVVSSLTAMSSDAAVPLRLVCPPGLDRQIVQPVQRLAAGVGARTGE